MSLYTRSHEGREGLIRSTILLMLLYQPVISQVTVLACSDIAKEGFLLELPPQLRNLSVFELHLITEK